MVTMKSRVCVIPERKPSTFLIKMGLIVKEIRGKKHSFPNKTRIYNIARKTAGLPIPTFSVWYPLAIPHFSPISNV